MIDITINPPDLYQALSALAGLVTPGIGPAHSNSYAELIAEDSHLKIIYAAPTGFFSAEIPAQVKSEGMALVLISKLLDVMSKLTEAARIWSMDRGENLGVSCGSSSFKIKGWLRDFDHVSPEIPVWTHQISQQKPVDSAALLSAINVSENTIDRKGAPGCYSTCAWISAEEGAVTSCDFSNISKLGKYNPGSKSAGIPYDSLNAMRGFLAAYSGHAMAIGVCAAGIVLRTSQAVIALMSGAEALPGLDIEIGKARPIEIEINVKELKKAIQGCKIFGDYIPKFIFSTDREEITILTIEGPLGSGMIKIGCAGDPGEEIELALNINKIGGFIKHLDTDSVLLCLKSATDSVVFRHPTDPEIMLLCAPVRVMQKDFK